MDLVDKVRVFRIAVNEFADDWADDGDLLSAVTDLVEDAGDELSGDALCRYG
jgi:hypothetical protein